MASEKAAKTSGADTPMMRQYLEIKEQHQESVLFFRMGDFYEMFFSDAERVSQMLNITLTKRQGIPMCGIPYHAANNYINRLLQFGQRIAICEQTEAPQKGKGLTKREVVEIISPGTILEEGFLDQKQNNYLMALGHLAGAQGAELTVALLDFSTGEFYAGSFAYQAAGSLEDNGIELLQELIQREVLLSKPREILILESLHDSFPSDFWGNVLINRIPEWYFRSESAQQKLCDFFSVQSMKGFGFEEGQAAFNGLGAAWVLLEYLEKNQKRPEVLGHIRRLKPLLRSEQLQLDSAALRNLEIFQNLQNGKRSYSLFEVLHDCQSAIGSRCLWRWLSQPLRDKQAIEQRLDRVERLYQEIELRYGLRAHLSRLSDLERLLGRVVTEKAHARDLVALRSSLHEVLGIAELLEPEALLSSLWAEKLGEAGQAGESRDKWRNDLDELRQLLERALAENPPSVIHEGKMMADGYNSELDELRRLLSDRKGFLNEYLRQEQEKSGISNLRIKYNKIIGYYFEISKGQTAKVPEYFIRRQSLVNAERYTTEALGELESKLSSADEHIVRLERQLFSELRDQVKPQAPLLLAIAQALAELDVLSNFAELAQRKSYCKPQILGEEAGPSAGSLEIREGRHPVVEHYLQNDDFIANDLELKADQHFALITGPNMAGKSTYLRQNALIVLMAQCGSFVPATAAKLSLADRIFCRVGASDNLSRGESTFMVEMQETARILNEASRHSLVIMDEVGRGTSTRDGLAIAWSICENLLDKLGCHTLFATHYHELTQLQNSKLIQLCLAVEDHGETIRFLKHVEKGSIASSYGIHVAALAGIPQEVILRAQQLLESLSGEAQQNLERLSKKSKGKEPLQEDFCGDVAAEASPEMARGGEKKKPKQAEEARGEQEVKPERRHSGLLFSQGDMLLSELEALDMEQISAIGALEKLLEWHKKYGRK